MPQHSAPQPHHHHICPHEHSFMLDNLIRKIFQPPGRILKKYIAPGDTLVDIGCGPGFFTTEMAKLTGESGKTFAVDLQEEMLERVRLKAEKHGLNHRIHYHRCPPDCIGLDITADFILAFYVVHETPDPENFFTEMKKMLKKGGHLLTVEPKFHVDKAGVENMIKTAARAGLKAVGFPKIFMSRSVLFS